jgi:ABC-type branched-subunit amino acid transport system ATPase component
VTEEQVRTAFQPSEPAVRLDGVRKEFGDVVAVDHVDLAVLAGEFFSMLGPPARARRRACE